MAGPEGLAEPDGARGWGCLMWFGLLGAGALAAAILWLTILNGTEETPSPGPTGAISTATTTAAATECADVTEEFRSTAAGPGIEYVRSVCWESGGQLRAEVELASDVNAESPPMQGLCTALTEFITASGRHWAGFTAYSASPLTAGQPLLTRAQPNQPCENPNHRDAPPFSVASQHRVWSNPAVGGARRGVGLTGRTVSRAVTAIQIRTPTSSKPTQGDEMRAANTAIGLGVWISSRGVAVAENAESGDRGAC